MNRWWRLGPAVATVAVVAFVLATSWSVLWASHPAYLVALGVVLALALLAAARGAPIRSGRLRWAGRGLVLVAGAVVLVGLVWLRPFPATGAALAAYGDPSVVVTESATRIELRPATGTATTGIVFWPGARVDARAYLGLLRPIAEGGALVVVLKEPFGISFLNSSAADGPIAEHPEIGRWTVGGHSLGGVTAASYALDHPRVGGLLLWASYPLDSLAGRTGLAVASVSGTQDGLTTPSDIAASVPKLPATTAFVAVQGAVHAYFGDYGDQPGDGVPAVSRELAQQQIVAATQHLVRGG